MSDPTIDVARDLTEIVLLVDALEDQAAHRPNDDIPGGNATVMLAGVASPEAWQWRIDAAEQRGEWPSLAHEDPEWEPPLQTLLFWSEQWRAERGEVTDLRPTIKREADYIRQALHWAVDHEPHLDDFAADIRAARTRLEVELRAGEQVDRTRVPCKWEDCEDKPQLVRVYTDDPDGEDGYRCPACRRSYTRQEFTLAQKIHLGSDGAEKWVRVEDGVSLLRSERPQQTVHRWLASGRVRRYCDVTTRQVYAWWPDVWTLHSDPPKRGRPVDAA